MRKLDLIHQKFGKLTVIDKDEPRGIHAYWRCVCECGKETSVAQTHLIRGNTISCGCLHKLRGQQHKDWRGHGEISGSFFWHIKNKAKQRGLDFKIDIKFLWALFLKQKKRCAISGLPLTMPSGSKDWTFTASLDRIDSSKGYLEGNVQWVHKTINLMKNDLGQDEFIKYCKAIVNHD